MRRCVGFILVASLLVTAGCAKKEMVLRSQREKTIKSAVSLSPGTTELLQSFALGPLLKGRTAADNYPANVSTIPVVASVKPDYEKIAEMKPDLILYDASLYSQQDLDKAKSLTGAEMFGISANSIDEFIEQIYDLGRVIGAESRMNDYVTKIYAEQQAAGATLYDPAPKVVVMMTGGSGGDYVAGVKGFIASAIKAAGGTAVGPDSTLFSPMNAEAIIALAPDVIVVPGNKDDVKSAMAILSNPRYKSMAAIKNRRVRVINEDVLLRRGARVDQLIKGLHTAMNPAGGN